MNTPHIIPRQPLKQKLPHNTTHPVFIQEADGAADVEDEVMIVRSQSAAFEG